MKVVLCLLALLPLVFSAPMTEEEKRGIHLGLDFRNYLKLLLKGKEHKNINGFCLKVFGKLHIFMQTTWKSDSYFFKILRLYIFKMATNGDHHFEINNKTKNYKI